MYTNHHCTEILTWCDTYVHFSHFTAILRNLYFSSPAYSIGSVARWKSTHGNRGICFTFKHCCTFLNGKTGKAATCSNEWNTVSHKMQTYIAHGRFLELWISSIFNVWHSETMFKFTKLVLFSPLPTPPAFLECFNCLSFFQQLWQLLKQSVKLSPLYNPLVNVTF